MRTNLGLKGRAASWVSWLSRYGLAVSSVALALLFTRALADSQIRGPLFIPAIMLTAWYGGVGPGLVATGLSLLAIHYFLLAPASSIQLLNLSDAVYLVVFAVSALFVAWLTGAQRRTAAALQRAHDELASRVQDVERTNERLELEIAERRQAETEVRNQANLLNLTHDSVIVRDADDIITYWNRGAADRYGWSNAEAVGQVSHQLLKTVFPASLDDIMAEMHRTGRWEGELVHTKRDGTQILIASRWSLQHDDLGEAAGILETNNDVTERREAENLVRQVFEVSPDDIAILGRDYRHQRVNPTYERVWGMPADTIVGKHIADLVGKDVFQQTIKPQLDRCFAGEAVDYGAWFVRPNGHRYIAVSYSPLRSRSPQSVDAALVIGRDLTDHIEAAEALNTARAELARVSRVTMLGEITTSIAHEINQPLAAVVMNGNACRRWLDADPPNLGEARDAARRIVSDATRAGQVIARIRALVRRETPEKSLLDVNDVVRETLAFTRGEVERHGASVREELAVNLPPVLGDRVQLQQVLVNLILNGLDAMEGVTERPRVLTIRSGRADPSSVAVEVTDSGKGIDPSQSDRIFEPFYSTKADGLGMGLAITRSIVEQHGGRIRATPSGAAGVTMRLTLPPASGGG
jgi:PAS domain S-box-containing protein